MRSLIVLGVVVLGCGLTAFAVREVATEGASATVLDEHNWDRHVPAGKEVDAIYEDIALENEHLIAVIAKPVQTRHANMTVQYVGGCLIDLTSREDQSDQLSAFYPGGFDASWYRASDIHKSEDGAAVTVTAPERDGEPRIATTYTLKSGSRAVEVTTSVNNVHSTPIEWRVQDAMRLDTREEDVDRSESGTHRYFWHEDRHWRQAYIVVAKDSPLQCEVGQRETRLRYSALGDQGTVKLAPGESFEWTRWIMPGESLLHARAALREHQGQKRGSNVSIEVVDANGWPVRNARLHLPADDGATATLVPSDQGTTSAPLPEGQHDVKVSLFGNMLNGTFTIDASSESSSARIELRGVELGAIDVTVTDGQSQAIPSKTELIPLGTDDWIDFGPSTGEFAVRNVRYAPHGKFEQDLLPGRYRLITSHGPEYDADVREVSVEAGDSTSVEISLPRVVDTTGWISSDFHSHSSPSGDNTSSQLGRVLNLLCEHIEFAPCTEHNRISTYDPHIESLDVGRFMATVSGMELTGKPLPLNHQNAFPLHHHPHRQDGGGPVTDTDPDRQVERLHAWDNRSEKLLQQNHPDLGWLVYDRDGDGIRDEGHARAWSLVDCVEIHPITAALDFKEGDVAPGRIDRPRIFNWLQLLNQGHVVFGVVNTDAHYNHHGSGWLRNWIQSPTDNPAEVQPLDMVHAAESGHLLMSNGPFLEVYASNGSGQRVTAGGDLAASDGGATLHVRVQRPNWFEVDRVFVLVNGRLSEEHDYRRDTHPDLFGDSNVAFDQELEIELDEDAHLIVVAGGENSKLGPVAGPEHEDDQPAAMINPIFVDVDGGGFRPNGDTLGHPLPVKQE